MLRNPRGVAPPERAEPRADDPAVDAPHGRRLPDDVPASAADARAWRAALSGRVLGPADASVREVSAPAPVTLAIVVPCFNEEEVLPTTIERLAELRDALLSERLILEGSTVVFVDDGSSDSTWAIVEDAARALPWVHGVRLSRNRGHQNALVAGLMSASGDAVVSIDADLQDDLGTIREMLLEHARGAEIVYGVRSERRADTRFKRVTAEAYYRLLRLFGVDVVFNHADYRFMGRRAIAALREFGEVNLFLRGIVPQLGFRRASVYYERVARTAGTSKYPLLKMLALAWEGITSFSAIPLRWITLLGFTVSALSFAVGCWAFGVRLLVPGSVPGWASTVVPIAFLGGIQLLSLGVIGEYVGKTYVETKRRPRFIIEKSI
jgi:glycosyltransferase involved in cell wall biosynthesis